MDMSAQIPLPVIDTAFDQAQMSGVPSDLTAAGILGHKHGIRLLRQRIGGQFVVNRGHFITLDQQSEVVDELTHEIERHEAPSPEPTPAVVRRSDEYWHGFGTGVQRYADALAALAMPDEAPSLRQRRPV